ncbi:hypothetical protein ACHAWT_002289 [Skeletonema menzelii]
MGLFRHHHRHHTDTATTEANAEAAQEQDTFETHFLRYLRTFDGSKREFSEVEALFNQLYDDDFYESKNDTLITKDQVKQSHTRLFELGSKVTLIHFKHKGVNHVDIKYRLVNAECDRTIHQLITTKDRKIIRAENPDQAKQEREIHREEVRMEECPRREVRREERMMCDDPYADPYMMDPYAEPCRRGGLMHDIRRDERRVRRDERMCRRF